MARPEKLRVDIEANDRASAHIDRVADKADALDKKDPKVTVDADTASAKEKLNELFDILDDSDLPIDGMGSKLKQLASPGGAIAAIGAGLLLATQHAAGVAIEAENLATLTGDSVEQASRLNAVWKQGGADSKDLQDVLLQMNDVLTNNAELADTLGVNLDDGASLGERFTQVSQALDKIPDAAKRSQLAAQLFGEEGVRQYNEMRNAVGELSTAMNDVPSGSVIDEDDVEKARQMQEQMAEVSAEFQAFAASIGTVVLPALGALFEGFNGLFSGAESVGQSIRGWFDGGEAERNREFASSIEAAESAFSKFDTTLLDGVTNAQDAKAIAEEFATALGEEADQLHATNLVMAEWGQRTKEAEEAQDAAKKAAIAHSEAQRDQARAADNTATVLAENNAELEKLRGFAERAAEYVAGLGTEWDQFKAKLDDKQAMIDLQTKFGELGTKAQEAIDAGSAATLEQQTALINLQTEVGNYLVKVGNVPADVATKIVANIENTGVEHIQNLLKSWGTGVTLPIKPVVINTSANSRIRIDESGNVRNSHTGTRIGPGEQREILAGESFVPDVPGRIESREDTRRALGGHRHPTTPQAPMISIGELHVGSRQDRDAMMDALNDVVWRAQFMTGR